MTEQFAEASRERVDSDREGEEIGQGEEERFFCPLVPDHGQSVVEVVAHDGLVQYRCDHGCPADQISRIMAVRAPMERCLARRGPLSQAHRDHLALSGVSDEVIAIRGYWTITKRGELSGLGFTKDQVKKIGMGNLPVMGIPWHDPISRRIATVQVRRDPTGPRKTKYLFPAGTQQVVDVLPSTQDRVRNPEVPLWVCEGVKKADCLSSRGAVALAINGVYGWRGKIGEEQEATATLPIWEWVPLRGRTVRIVADSDAAHNDQVKAAIIRLGRFLAAKDAQVWIIVPPSGPDGQKWGCDDSLIAGGTMEGLIEIASPLEEKEAELARPSWMDERFDRIRQNDMANAIRFYQVAKGEFLWVSTWQKFVAWDGASWDISPAGDAEMKRAGVIAGRWLTDLEQEIEEHAGGIAGEWRPLVERARRFFQSSCDAGRLRAFVRLMGHFCAVRHQVFEGSPYLTNAENGTLEFSPSGAVTLREFRRDDHLMHRLAVPYDPKAGAPLWERFLAQITSEDHEMIRFLKVYFGSCLIGVVGEHRFPIFIGEGANGKSTVIKVIAHCLGSLATPVPPSVIEKKWTEAHPTELAQLFQRRLGYIQEVGEGRELNWPRIKALTGGDQLTVRRMREDYWLFEPTFKLLMTTNHPPEIHHSDVATRRRLLLVPFKWVIPEEERDPLMPQRLIAEAPGILKWLVEGACEWLRDGLRYPIPGEVIEETESTLTFGDPVEAFLAAKCDRENPNAFTTTAKLYEAYRPYAQSMGFTLLSLRSFGRRLSAKGLRASDRLGGRGHFGVRLR